MQARIDRIPGRRVYYIGEHIFAIVVAPYFAKCHMFTLKTPFKFASLGQRIIVSDELNEQIVGLVDDDDDLFTLMQQLDKNAHIDHEQ